jgi:hypothetical protein
MLYSDLTQGVRISILHFYYDIYSINNYSEQKYIYESFILK